MKLTWLGHSCFRIESKDAAIITDPYEAGSVPGYRDLNETADLILCSHEHSDHNGRAAVKLTGEKNNVFSISEIDTFHDPEGGRLRGTNKMFVISDGDTKIAHLGDIGCALTPDQISKLKGLDVLLIPVGGYFTIDAKQAKEIASQLSPKVIIPMHFRNDDFGTGYDVIGTVDEFASLYDNVTLESCSTFDTASIKADFSNKVVVLKPANVN